MKTLKKLVFFSILLITISCGWIKDLTNSSNSTNKGINQSIQNEDKNEDFIYLTEQFSDLKLIRYQVPGFEELELRQKKLIYYLSQASLSGRDIIFDQNYRHNLRVRRTLETIVANYTGDRTNKDFTNFMTYTKRVWFSGGIHHHYSSSKLNPEFSSEYFINELISKSTSSKEYSFPLIAGENKMDLGQNISDIIFDVNNDSKRVNRDANIDIILNSANNYYGPNVTNEDVNLFYQRKIEERAPEYGLNSKLIKNENGEIYEKTYKIDGMYNNALEKMIYWIEKAKSVAENEDQKESFDLLIEYYTTGDINTWDKYCVKWVSTETDIDWINGFVEVYGDAAGRKGAYESIVFTSCHLYAYWLPILVLSRI